MCVVSIFPFTRVNQIAIFIIVRAFSALLSFFELSLIHNLSIIVIQEQRTYRNGQGVLA